MNKYCISILLLLAMVVCGCEPEAKWTNKTVDIKISIKNISAAFIECDFSTSTDNYYLIAIEPARDNYDPMAHQKQFMMLALDSANLKYLQWRNRLFANGEFNVAPFASHALQYGAINHIFTGLWPDTDYWIYAFTVNPETLEPIGTLHLQTIHTARNSQMDVHFEYRVKGNWDYIYPVDSIGNIVARFPYTATTRDSIELAQDTLYSPDSYSPAEYFIIIMLNNFIEPENTRVLYGVQAIENNGIASHLKFEEGHTYYTGIGGYDGNFKQVAIYKFVWKGPETEYYFYESDPANIINSIPESERWWSFEYEE